MAETKTKFERSAGVLMSISSLPSPYGIGTLGRDAYEFVDYLDVIKHSYWQVLPLGPTSYGDSPYQSYSAFAGNHYFIDLDMLGADGLLDMNEVRNTYWGSNPEQVDYGTLFNNRRMILKKAATKFFDMRKETAEYEKFCRENAEWLDDFALFMSCKAHFEYKAWSEWDDDIKFRKPAGIAKYNELLKVDIDFWKFTQYEFFKQWDALKEYANKKNIEIIGDIPIYMAYDSVDVWANTKFFQLDEELAPVDVAGVPPDAFTDLGQKWGNPLYDWDKLEAADFEWWRKRITASAKLYDVIRIDHFIGIVKYYAIPAEMPDAKKGEYRKGPAGKLTKVINECLNGKKLIAEDLGVELKEVNDLLLENGYPGMKIIEFAFGGDRKNTHLPYNYSSNCVVYGGTHDNETLMGYFNNRGDWELGYAFDYLDTRDKRRMVDAVFRLAYGSVAHTVIFQTQDILKLDNWARMNFPSTMGTNWMWRMKKGALSQQQINDMRYLASVFGRERQEKPVVEEKTETEKLDTTDENK